MKLLETFRKTFTTESLSDLTKDEENFESYEKLSDYPNYEEED